MAEYAVKLARKKAEVASVEKVEQGRINKLMNSYGELKAFETVASGVTVTKLCETLGILPARFYDWVNRREERIAALARAREMSAHSLVDQALDIADASTIEEVPLAKLRADIRLKLAAKHNKAQYGDQQGPLVQLNIGDMALDALRRRTVDTE
jgi:hypothetical protein